MGNVVFHRTFNKVFFVSSVEFLDCKCLKDNNGMIATHEEVESLIPILYEFLACTNNEEIKKYNEEKGIEVFGHCKPVRINEIKPMPKQGYVYFVQDCYGNVKIGMSKNINSRIGEYTLLPTEPKLIHLIETSDMVKLECLFHEKFKKYRMRGEWFKLTEKNIKWICNKNYLKIKVIKEIVINAKRQKQGDRCGIK